MMPAGREPCLGCGWGPSDSGHIPSRRPLESLLGIPAGRLPFQPFSPIPLFGLTRKCRRAKVNVNVRGPGGSETEIIGPDLDSHGTSQSHRHGGSRGWKSWNMTGALGTGRRHDWRGLK